MCQNVDFAQFARFIAHVQADGCFSPERDTIRYFNKDIVLINDFRNSVKNCFGLECWAIYAWSTCLHTGFRNKKIIAKFKQYSFDSKNWHVPTFVSAGSADIIAAYLQAFFDDEGSAIFQKRKWGYDRAVQMQSINGSGLMQLAELLSKLGIESNFHGPYKHKYFELKITGKKNLCLFKDKVNFVSKKKRGKLEIAVGTYRE